MTPERWAQIETLFHRAADCEPEHRIGLLDEACRNDPELRQEVEALLSSDGSAGTYVRAVVHSEFYGFAFPLAGTTISHYRILGGLGGGGMGLVYSAEDIRLGRRVALKFLPEGSTKDPAALGRFEREARSASALEHPNICPIYEFGEHEGRPFLVMQLLEGQTLRELIAAASPGKPPLEIEKLLDLAIQIVDGLDAAHQKGIIHRDIKPANIFVTSKGEARILDFGLAKLAPAVTVMAIDSQPDHRDEAPETPRDTTQLTLPDPFLSRTGVAMGTAGYMSPEQVRGEKLDARTDLFSFGLVLYEIATGQRAFSGDTGPDLHEAILNQVPAPARKLNPSIPPKLEPIINKALQKDREARYQSAAELLTDLETLRRALLPKPRTLRWLGVAAVVLAVLVVSTVVWIKSRPLAVVPNLKLRQLTFNPPENPVTSGAISPDGKYLAYSDTKGMHIQIVDTGEIRTIPPPDLPEGTKVNWEIFHSLWFPDSTRFIANAHPADESGSEWGSQTTSIWMVTVNGGAPRKVRDNAMGWAVSPDGSSIAFGTNKGKYGDREIWLMGPNGEQDRKLFDAGAADCLAAFVWRPDGQRVFYVRSPAPCQGDAGKDTLVSSDLKGGPTFTVFSPVEMKNVWDATLLPDGRLLYAVREPQGSADPSNYYNYWITSNYWTVRLDARTGQPIEEPKRLTNWAGFSLESTGATVDGKRLAFLEYRDRHTVFVADLVAGGTRIRNPRQFTLGEDTFIQGWTPDSKTILLSASRAGTLALYKQSLNTDEAEVFAGGTVGFHQARVSADGKWVIGFLERKPGGPSSPDQLMRIPFAGGSPELIFTTSPVSLISCANSATNLCVIAEITEDRKQRVFTSFDPVKGRGPELARFDNDPNAENQSCDCQISPDGTRLAVEPGGEGPIHILSLRGQPVQVIQPKGLKIREYYWAADSRGLYVSSNVKRNTALLHVDLQGNPHVVWEGNGNSYTWGIPSPDGRHLAFMGWTDNRNMWMMEKF